MMTIAAIKGFAKMTVIIPQQKRLVQRIKNRYLNSSGM
jgi:hypothetical protein